jgi:hypothetical protein
MVSFATLIASCKRNPKRTFTIHSLTYSELRKPDVFPLAETKQVNNIIKEDQSILNKLVDKPVLKVEKSAVASTVTTVTTIPTRVAKADIRPPLYEPKTSNTIIDPLILGVELTDPLYSMSPYNTKRDIECASARDLESRMNELYKSESGRSRGWLKGGLEQFIKPRCSSGGNLQELHRAKSPFLWQCVADEKTVSAFLDFVCTARHIRVAVWFPDTKTVYLYPAADSLSAVDKTIPLYHVTCKGELRHGRMNGKELLDYAKTTGYTVLPTYSVINSLNHLTLEELGNVAKGLGMGELAGKKPDRVAAIAAFKVAQRLTAV